MTGFGEPDPNILDVGLARTGDGVLHVLWSREPTGDRLEVGYQSGSVRVRVR